MGNSSTGETSVQQRLGIAPRRSLTLGHHCERTLGLAASDMAPARFLLGPESPSGMAALPSCLAILLALPHSKLATLDFQKNSLSALRSKQRPPHATPLTLLNWCQESLGGQTLKRNKALRYSEPQGTFPPSDCSRGLENEGLCLVVLTVPLLPLWLLLGSGEIKHGISPCLTFLPSRDLSHMNYGLIPGLSTILPL